MEKSLEIIQLLNDLISVHRWRVGNYNCGIRLLPKEEMQMEIVFKSLISESNDMITELVREVEVLRGDIRSEDEKGGRLLQAWEGFRLTGMNDDMIHNKKPILQHCINAEGFIQQVYAMALHSAVLPKFIQQILTRQQKYLNISRDELLAFSD